MRTEMSELKRENAKLQESRNGPMHQPTGSGGEWSLKRNAADDAQPRRSTLMKKTLDQGRMGIMQAWDEKAPNSRYNGQARMGLGKLNAWNGNLRPSGNDRETYTRDQGGNAGHYEPWRGLRYDHHEAMNDFAPRRDVPVRNEPAPRQDALEGHYRQERQEVPQQVRGQPAALQQVRGQPAALQQVCGQPAAPKMATFDGRQESGLEWSPFILQFERMAERYNWDVQECLDRLVECLRGKALTYFAKLPGWVREDYAELVWKLETRFGRREPPTTVRRKLQDLKQEVDETLEEFAERTLVLATEGFPGAQPAMIETLAADAFLKGCREPLAALTAMNQNPATLDEALQLVKATVHNQNVLMGDRTTRSKLRQVLRFEDDEDALSKVRVTAAEQDMRVDQLSSDIASLKVEVSETKSQIGDILALLRSRPRSPSPNFNRGECFKCGVSGHYQNECPIEREGRACFQCGHRGHLSRDCPSKAATDQARPRSNSPARRQRSRSPVPKMPLNC